MTTSVKEPKEGSAQKETLMLTQKKSLEETKRGYRGALGQLSRVIIRSFPVTMLCTL